VTLREETDGRESRLSLGSSGRNGCPAHRRTGSRSGQRPDERWRRIRIVPDHQGPAPAAPAWPVGWVARMTTSSRCWRRNGPERAPTTGRRFCATARYRSNGTDV